ncbi:hypothetical protein L917_01741, partial [Phytophthora nicotianae]
RKNVILIQQDNLKPHIAPSDPDIVAAGTADGWNIRLFFRPANSSETNALDLGLFASLQALQLQKTVNGNKTCIKAVDDAYKAMNADILDHIFPTLQKCMECTLGSNEYKLPHVGKARLRREVKLPTSFECDRETYTGALAILKKAGRPFLF